MGQAKNDPTTNATATGTWNAEAENFRQTMQLVEGRSYGWVSDYAKFIFERTAKIYGVLDDKANDIIKYLGGGTGLFTIAALANAKPDNAFVFVAALPSFGLAIASIYYACLSRQPRQATEPPGATRAFDYANRHDTEGEAQAYFVSEWNIASVEMHAAIAKKSALVKRATWLFFWTIALLSLPVIVSVATMLCHLKDH